MVVESAPARQVQSLTRDGKQHDYKMAVRASAVCARRFDDIAERDTCCSVQSLVFDVDCFGRNQSMGVCCIRCLPRLACTQAIWGQATMRLVIEYPLLENSTSGAGGNRTPVHQPLNARDTTIPDTVATQQHRRVDWLMPKH